MLIMLIGKNNAKGGRALYIDRRATTKCSKIRGLGDSPLLKEIGRHRKIKVKIGNQFLIRRECVPY